MGNICCKKIVSSWSILCVWSWAPLQLTHCCSNLHLGIDAWGTRLLMARHHDSRVKGDALETGWLQLLGQIWQWWLPMWDVTREERVWNGRLCEAAMSQPLRGGWKKCIVCIKEPWAALSWRQGVRVSANPIPLIFLAVRGGNSQQRALVCVEWWLSSCLLGRQANKRGYHDLQLQSWRGSIN